MALLVDLASLLTREGKPADAESCLKQVMTREPHARVAVGLISVASSLKNERQRDCVERANCLLRCASEILQNMPSDDLAELPGWAISQLLDGGFKQQATNICWRMLESSCTNAAWFNEASWLLATAANPSNRDPSLAVELAKRSVKLNGDWNTLGVARYRAGDFKQAIADLEKCESLAAQPNVGSSFNYFFMAMAHHRRGDDTAARRCYEQAIKWMKEHSPQNPELIRFRAEAEALLGPTVQAHAQKQPEAP